MNDQSQPPLPSEGDYGAQPGVPGDLNPEDFDLYSGEVREPEPQANGELSGSLARQARRETRERPPPSGGAARAARTAISRTATANWLSIP